MQQIISRPKEVLALRRGEVRVMVGGRGRTQVQFIALS